MRLRALFAMLAATTMLAPGRSARAEAPPSDPKALAIADQVMEALGGKDRWDKLHGLRWSFDVSISDTMKSSRRHAWDKMTGWHRVEGIGRTGQPFLLIEQIDGKGGMAWMNSQSIPAGDSLRDEIALARRFDDEQTCQAPHM